MNIRELDKIKDKGAKVSNDQWVKKKHVNFKQERKTDIDIMAVIE